MKRYDNREIIQSPKGKKRLEIMYPFQIQKSFALVWKSLKIFNIGSLGIAPTQNCTHFLKICFFLYYIHQGNKSDKERNIVRKKLSFMHTKRFNKYFKRWVQFRVGAIPRLPIYAVHLTYLGCWINVDNSESLSII